MKADPSRRYCIFDPSIGKWSRMRMRMRTTTTTRTTSIPIQAELLLHRLSRARASFAGIGPFILFNQPCGHTQQHVEPRRMSRLRADSLAGSVGEGDGGGQWYSAQKRGFCPLLIYYPAYHRRATTHMCPMLPLRLSTLGRSGLEDKRHVLNMTYFTMFPFTWVISLSADFSLSFSLPCASNHRVERC